MEVGQEVRNRKDLATVKQTGQNRNPEASFHLPCPPHCGPRRT